MARGGKRTGSPRTAYENRTDLSMAPTEFTGQDYGARKEQVSSQQAVPLQRRPPMPSGPSVPVTPLDAPTARPGEPVTTGLPVGLGAGPEALMGGGGDRLAALRAALFAAGDRESIEIARYLLDESL